MESKALTKDAPSTSQTSSARSGPRTVLLQELINIRNSIKKIQDWLPPTSSPTSPSPPASDVPSTLESPLTGKGLSLNFDEMTRSRLLKFFEKIVDVIEKKSQQEQTIGDLLTKHPLIRTVTKGTMMSINMFLSGMEVDQISLERDSEPTTIMNHLCTGLLTNNRIDIGRLLPAYKLASIIQVLQSPTINYNMKSLPPIKKLCRNPRVTFHEVSICRAYLEVRQHLMAMNLSYEDDYSLVTVDNKSEYKSKFVTPEHNTLTFLPKCTFPLRSKEKKDINICSSASNTKPVPVQNELFHAYLPMESSIKVESSEIKLFTQSDIKPSKVKLESISAVIDISDSELTEGELEQNENATESNYIKGSISDEEISEEKKLFSDYKILKNERFSPGPSVPLKAIHEDFPLQEQSKSTIIGVQNYPKSNNQTEFIVEWDASDEVEIIKKENIDEKVSEAMLIDDAEISSNIIIIDDDDDDDKSDVNIKDALSKFNEVQGEGNYVAAVKQEVKTEVKSFPSSTVNTNIIQDTTKSTRKRKLDDKTILWKNSF